MITEIVALALAAVVYGWGWKTSALFAGPRALLERALTREAGPDNPALHDPLGLGWGRRRDPWNRLAGLILYKYTQCVICAGFDATVAGWLLLHGFDQWRAGVVVVAAANGAHVVYEYCRPVALADGEAD